jgi:hypothetical protein
MGGSAAIVRAPSGKTSVVFRGGGGSGIDFDKAQLDEARQVWQQLGPVLAEIAGGGLAGQEAKFSTDESAGDIDSSNSSAHGYTKYLAHSVAPKHAFGL